MVLSPVQLPDSPLETILARLKGVRASQHGWVACCPAHSDREPSLSIGLGDEGHILLNCFAGCSLESIVEAMGITMAELFPNARSVSDAPAEQTQRMRLDLVDLAREKQLPWKYLFHLGITEQRAGCLQIPYHLPDGTLAPRHRLRTALVAKEGSHWSKGQGEIVPYGLQRLEEARKAGYLVLVEGESDCWTLWLHQFPALGLPGAEMVRTLKADYLAGIEKLYIVRESDVAGARFVEHLQRLLEKWKWPGKALVVSLVDAKDPNELHKRDWRSFKAAFQQTLDRSEPLSGAYTQPVISSSEYIPNPFTLPELLARRLPPIQWAIPDILPEGLTILAGKPKLGKSWLALSVALAVAAGGVALGTYHVTQGEVLYLALEDNERRLQSRVKQLLASMSSVPNTIEFELRWPRLDQGGLTYLEEYLQAHPHVRLVVVDTWARVSPRAQHRQRSQYEDDYAALTPLKYLSDTYRVSILAIHHLRKMRGDDVLDEITGSIGLTGVVDGALVLKRERGQHEATLFVTGRDIEQEQQFALRFDPLTALWMQVGNAEEVRRTKERQEILDLLTEQLPEGMSARQVAEALDKNYHTTRCLLRKMEAAGEICHINNHYFAFAGDHSRIQCNQRNQSEPSALQPISQIEQSEEPCPPASDYSDDGDYAHQNASANESRTQSIPPPFGGCSLQFPLGSTDLLSERVVVPDSQDQCDDIVNSVINRNHHNQSMSATIRAEEHFEQSASKWTDYSDYDDAIDYGDYAANANDSVSAYWLQIHEADPRLADVALELPAAEALLSHTEDVQRTQDLRVDYAIAVINRNQSLSATTQVSNSLEQSAPQWTDCSDYGDDTDYTNECVSAYRSQRQKPDSPPAGTSLQYQSTAGDLLIVKEDESGAQDHRVNYAINVISRNHRNQSDLQCSQSTLRVERHENDSAPDTNDSSPGNARASPDAQSKKRCPHHPHARWVRFDPSGQAWCDKMDCWDCYRLMKIGEALDYRPLSKYARGIVSIEHGMEAWSSFVTSQGSFAVLTATQYAIDLCKRLRLQVPDLSGEVKRLVSAGG